MEFQEAKLASCFRGDEYGVSSLVFDPQEELLWAATFGGHVTSFLGAEMETYTSYQAHHSDIRQLELAPSGVLSISDRELRYTTRTGLPMYTLRDVPQLTGMNCMLYVDESNLLVGCQTGRLVTTDLSTMQVTSERTLDAGVCLLKASEHLLCTADVTGQVYLQQPGSLEVLHRIPAHSAGMSDMDVVGHFLVTCGLTQQYGQLCIDQQLSVVDLRILRPLPPTPVSMPQPMLVKAMPILPSTVLLLSQLGEFQFLDLRGLLTPSTMMVHHLRLVGEGTMPCAMDIAPSCHCLGFGDSCGLVHLWMCGEESVMNAYAQPSVLPHEVEPVPELRWDGQGTPLAAVPLPVCSGPLLSDWPVQCSRFIRRRAPTLDPDVLAKVKMKQFVGHAPKPAHLRRNQVPYDLQLESRASVPESPMMRETNPLSLIPKPYRQVEIKYSKLGIETFDFGHYNDTKFAGLEIHIPNAYCNSMLQVLYFLEPIRQAMLNHLCAKEFCLACELGFLFRMLDSSTGKSCQATNFLRAFRTLREASALGLLISREEEEKKTDLGKLIQNWNRFVLQQLHQEMQLGGVDKGGGSGGGEEKEGEESVVEKLFGCEVETVSVCRCGWSASRKSTELLFSLTYPPATEGQRVGFGQVLESSMCRQQRVHAWCDSCGKFKPTTQQRSVCGLPLALSLNCQVEGDAEREFWRVQQQADGTGLPWVPLGIRMSLGENGRLHVQERERKEWKKSDWREEQRGDGQCEESAEYDLSMVVAHVKESWMEVSGNLVTHILVSPFYHARKKIPPKHQWYLFNDFAITPVDESAMAVFSLEWLTPCILLYTQKDYATHFDMRGLQSLEPSVLLAETHPPRPLQSPTVYTALSMSELPEKGDLVGIDAEFVTLNQGEAEVKSDGTHTTVKPSQLSVARITVVRGKSPMEGSPFIDDYIAHSEQVVDYLTQFSGIKPGDLDAGMSSKHLTTLKAAYLKLLYLLERGVKFVGHGLKKDFRVINILVPDEQVVDTVSLFHLPKQRYISLKFLAWFYLKLHVQDGAHDSAEDAKTALLLYRKYQQLQSDGLLAESLSKLYETGRSLNWQVPGS